MKTLETASLFCLFKMAFNRIYKDYKRFLPPFYPQPITVEIDTIDGFQTNVVTGDKIHPKILKKWKNLIGLCNPNAKYQNLSCGTFTGKIRAIGKSGQCSVPFNINPTVLKMLIASMQTSYLKIS
ncbi:MAG: hypothetical protein JJU02_01315 [Cryomorphaceae bacterium]|nr:hypothetical protein [Cryomorphaceae bacterium]